MDTSEDATPGLIIVKTKEQLQAATSMPEVIVQDCVGTLKHSKHQGERDWFMYFGRLQSEYRDGSGMDTGLVGGAQTKGELISNAWKYGYRVFMAVDGIKTEITKDGLISLPGDAELYYTAPCAVVQ